MNDYTNSIYEHLKNRLPEVSGYGNYNSVKDKNGYWNHQVSQQSLRDDHEGDVGIFELNVAPSNTYLGNFSWDGMYEIVVVCISGNIQGARSYLMRFFNNIVNDIESSKIYVNDATILNVVNLGKNGSGKQTVALNINISYTVK